MISTTDLSYEGLDLLTNKIGTDLLNEIIDTNEPDKLYLNYLNLTKLNESCTILGKELTQRQLSRDSNQLRQVQNNLYKIITTINYELFKNEKLLQEQQVEEDLNEVPIDDIPIKEDIEDVSELRKRLLSTNNTPIEEIKENSIELNEYHENLQEEVLSDISNLANYLKNSMNQFQNLIENDNNVMQLTQDKLLRNQDLFRLNLSSLANFNKNGKLSYWELLKIFVLFTLLAILTFFILSIF